MRKVRGIFEENLGLFLKRLKIVLNIAKFWENLKNFEEILNY